MEQPLRLVDRFDGGLGWVAEGAVPRTSHALAVDGKVWLVDPVDPESPTDSVLEAVAELGEIAGVIQLLDRHNRDCGAIAARLGVPHVHAYGGPESRNGLVQDFELRPVVSRRFWREVALWWPERRVLVCADVLGTLPYFCAQGERLGVHPLLRLFPPRSLRGLAPERILVGHGEGIDDGAAEALAEALSTSRRRAPSALANGLVRAVRARRASRRR